MDQRRPRDLEARCIQEEPPRCRAACPLGLDARALCRTVAAGDLAGAWAVLSRHMPLPGALARICDHPCQSACLRAEAGGAIRIGAIERAVAATPEPRARVLPMPRRQGRVAVLGAGLASLSAASDLLAKGLAVTVTSGADAPGGRLRDLPEALLPASVLAAEIARLTGRGLVLDLSARPERLDPEALLSEFDAVLLGDDEPGGLPAAGLTASPDTLATDREGLFLCPPAEPGWPGEPDALAGPDGPARPDGPDGPDEPGGAGERAGPGGHGRPGGPGGMGGPYSPARAAALGRKAALSIDRYLQKVSLTAGRADPGTGESRLFTSLEGVRDRPPTPMADPAAGYDPDEARSEAERCLQCQCLECVKACPYLERHQAYPRVYARQIYNNAAIVKGQHTANTLINSCMLCGLCTLLCPEDFPMAATCLEARRDMVARGKMPPSVHEFALMDMDAALSETAFLVRHAPGATQSRAVFFPGCQLAGTRPDAVLTVYAALLDLFPEGIGLALSCCGAPARWAGREDRFGPAMAGLAAFWEESGRPLIVAACPTCLNMIASGLPEAAAISLWEVLDRAAPSPAPPGPSRATGPMAQAGPTQATGPLAPPGPSSPAGPMIPTGPARAFGHLVTEGPSTVPPGPGRAAGPLALHDPCAARERAPLRQAVRGLLARLGQAVEELPFGREKTKCCGFGGLLSEADPDLAAEVARRRAAESPADFVTYCAMCRDRLARTGKRVVHLLDLLFPDAAGPPDAPEAASGRDPAARPPVGLSERRDNRAWLKREVTRRLYGQETPEPAGGPVLHISPEVAASLEARRILHDDIRAVVAEAERTGRKFRHRPSGRFLASARPGNATFWVAYSPTSDGLTIHGAYSHRMDLTRDEA